MRIFDFDPRPLRETYDAQGWVHVRDGATPEFLAELRRSYEERSTRPDHSSETLRGIGIAGAKDQFLFQPPADLDLVGELRRLTSVLCGLDPRGFAVSERHIKWYSADADPDPAAHKDRLASLVSIGVSIEVPPGSRLVLYPSDNPKVNPFLTTDLRASLDSDELPEVVLADAAGIEIVDRPGDVVVFRGSEFWHRRLGSANTVNLYLKCNDFDCDPLGEDPSTEARRRSTVQWLSDEADSLGGRLVKPGRRLEWVGTIMGRDGEERVFAKMWGEAAVALTSVQGDILGNIGSGGCWSDGTAHLGASELEDRHQALTRMARRGLIDVVEPGVEDGTPVRDT